MSGETKQVTAEEMTKSMMALDQQILINFENTKDNVKFTIGEYRRNLLNVLKRNAELVKENKDLKAELEAIKDQLPRGHSSEAVAVGDSANGGVNFNDGPRPEQIEDKGPIAEATQEDSTLTERVISTPLEK